METEASALETLPETFIQLFTCILYHILSKLVNVSKCFLSSVSRCSKLIEPRGHGSLRVTVSHRSMGDNLDSELASEMG